LCHGPSWTLLVMPQFLRMVCANCTSTLSQKEIFVTQAGPTYRGIEAKQRAPVGPGRCVSDRRAADSLARAPNAFQEVAQGVGELTRLLDHRHAARAGHDNMLPGRDERRQLVRQLRI